MVDGLQMTLCADCCSVFFYRILRNVFAKTEEKVVRSTVQRLPPQYVASLVEELTSLTQQKTLK